MQMFKTKPYYLKAISCQCPPFLVKPLLIIKVSLTPVPYILPFQYFCHMYLHTCCLRHARLQTTAHDTCMCPVQSSAAHIIPQTILAPSICPTQSQLIDLCSSYEPLQTLDT